MSDIKVILSRIEGPVNLGFIARAMANTGFSNLAYSGDIDSTDEEALKYAVHADNILQSSLQAENFESLIADSDIVIGFSPRDPYTNGSLEFDDLKEYVQTCLKDGLSIGLLFGNEASGLDNIELAACAKRVSLPTCSDYVSMNLAQAVLVVLWELKKVVKQKSDSKEYASREILNILSEKTKDYLHLIEYLNKQNPDHIWQEVRQIIESKKLTSREAEILISIVGKSIIRYNHLKNSC